MDAICHIASCNFFNPSMSSDMSISPNFMASISICIPFVKTITSAANANTTAIITATAADAIRISGTKPNNALPKPFNPFSIATIPLPDASPPAAPPAAPPVLKIFPKIPPKLLSPPNTPDNLLAAYATVKIPAPAITP